MRKVLKIKLLVLFVNLNIFGQQVISSKYKETIIQAQELYKKNKYFEAGEMYSLAFAYFGNKGYVSDRYDSAHAWAKAGQPDSAFVQLVKIAQAGGFSNTEELKRDSIFICLQPYEKWKNLLNVIQLKKEKEEEGINKAVVLELDTIRRLDQEYRQQIKDYEAKFGWNSKEVNEFWVKINRQDSINLQKVERIIQNSGWPKSSKLGKKGGETVFLVVQHSNSDVQQKYLPILKEAFEKGEILGGNLAMLEDRLAIAKGEAQIYGTQVGRKQETGEYFIPTIIEPEKVNERRKERGLSTIEEYLKIWGLEWGNLKKMK